MSLYTLGLNHTTAPLDVRERVTFAPDALSDALRELASRRDGQGSGDPVDVQSHRSLLPWRRAGTRRALARKRARLPPAALNPYVYTLHGDRAVTHAFRVASGLDSMVLGEPQILGQMKQAVRSAEAAGSLGLVLNRLFQRTFAVAKDVRSQTDIGSASISMAAAAVKLAERIFPSIVRPATAADRRGRDDRARRDALREPPTAFDHRRQPHARARRTSSRTGSAPRRSR